MSLKLGYIEKTCLKNKQTIKESSPIFSIEKLSGKIYLILEFLNDIKMPTDVKPVKERP